MLYFTSLSQDPLTCWVINQLVVTIQNAWSPLPAFWASEHWLKLKNVAKVASCFFPCPISTYLLLSYLAWPFLQISSVVPNTVMCTWLFTNTFPFLISHGTVKISTMPWPSPHSQSWGTFFSTMTGPLASSFPLVTYIKASFRQTQGIW